MIRPLPGSRSSKAVCCRLLTRKYSVVDSGSRYVSPLVA
jgi:hypothetical protein